MTTISVEFEEHEARALARSANLLAILLPAAVERDGRPTNLIAGAAKLELAMMLAGVEAT